MMLNWLKNLNKKIMYRRSFFLVLAGSYTLLLLLPVVLSFIVYNSTSRIMSSELMTTYEIQRKLLVSRFEAQVSATENLMSRISANKKIDSFLRRDKNNEPDTVFERGEISQELQYAKTNMDFISDVYIFFKNRDLVITDVSPISKKVAYSIYHDREEFTFDEWKNMMEEDYVRAFVPVKMKPHGLYNDKEIAYMQTLPVAGAGEREATLVIIIETEKFMDAFAGFNSEKINTLFVTSKEGETLFTNGGEALKKELADRFTDKGGTFSEKIDGVPYMLTYTQSSINKDIYYAAMIPESAFWKNVRTTRNIALAAIGGMLVLGGFGVCYFSKKNFSPTQEIVKKINHDFGTSEEDIGNEHRYILNALSEAHRQIVSASNSLRKQNNKLRDYFLKGLLQGRYTDEQYIISNIKNYEIYADNGQYIVFILNVYECEDLFRDYDCSINEQEDTVSFILSNVLNDLFDEEYKCVTALLDENITACIVRAQDGAEETIKDVTRQTYEFVSENFGIYFTAAASGRHTFNELSEAYLEALSVSETEQSDDTIVFYTTGKKQEQDYSFDATTEQILLNFIKSGETQAAADFLSGFLDENKQLIKNKETSLSLKYDILSTMLKSLKGKEYEQFLSAYHPAVSLEKASTVYEVKSTLLGLLENICRYVRSSEKQDRSGSLCGKIIEFINENYGDSNLSVIMIGDHFDMTPHYLSKQFKNETGEYLKSYISTYRIQKSKELLTGSNKNLNEIAHEVGFIDSNAFIRVFKQYEGITPGKYREMHL